ncbi:MAG: hypothetical protein KAV83_06630 [Desulfobacterales bacterium]|nr:hypothetical protein [Desulfobacterales bacterium]
MTLYEVARPLSCNLKTKSVNSKLLAAAESEDPNVNKQAKAEELRKREDQQKKAPEDKPKNYVRHLEDRADYEIRCEYFGISHGYEPDFLLRMKDGRTLILEIKGDETDEEKAKHAAAKRWVSAVNNWEEIWDVRGGNMGRP